MITSSLRKTKNIAFSSESNQRIYEFLASQPIGVISSVDPDGNPHASVIYFAVDTNFTFTFTTKHDTKKHDNLMHNNHTMLVVFEPQSQTTAQVTGIAQPVEDEAYASKIYRQTVRASLASSEGGIPPISKLVAGDYVAYAIQPLQIRMAIFQRPDSGGYEIFETIYFTY